ncbi:MAG: type VII secretion protein EssC [Eubacterium sp.]|nr:type VII secretion protein EssC [Eubacterium sp.]
MNYIISFIYKNHFTQKRLEDGGKLTIGSSSKDTINCEDYKSSQLTLKNKGILTIKDKGKTNFDFSKDIIGIHMIAADPLTLLYISEEATELNEKIELPHNASITVGRSDKCNISIKNQFVSSKHCVIKRKNGVYYIEDNGSTNGTYVNNLKVNKSKISTGDEVHIFNYTFKLESGKLTVLNAGEDVTVNFLPSAVTNEKGSAYVMGERPIYQRSPRTQEEMPHDDIILASPPSKGQKYEKQRGLLSSIANSAAMVGSSMFMGGAASAAMVAARASMLVMPATSIASQTSTSSRNKKKSQTYAKLREARFADYLNEQRARIFSVANQQQKIISDENPSPADCIITTEKLNRNLWERTPSDRDFLDVRLGMGYEELCVKVKDRSEAYGIEIEDDDAKQMSAMLVEESKYVDNIPVRVSLAQNSTIGVIGNRKRVIEQVKNMITSLTTLHCYTDVKVVGIFDEEEYDDWADLRWLPHTWDDNKQMRYIAFNKEDAHAICDGFNDMLKTRKREMKDNVYRKVHLPIPYYIFVLGSKRLLENEEIMANLLTNNPQMGVTSLFLFDDIYSLPPACEYIIEMQDNPVAYWKSKVNSKFIFTKDEYSAEKFDAFARRMSAIELKGYAVQAEIPSSVTFLQGYGVKTIEELNILERWNSNKAYQSLAAPIGVLAGDKTFSLNIRENKSSTDEHGPHGLVAGTTGSGKSELLQTWILSMCVNYHPYEVNFVIIDYKGGGMANLLEDMPHVVGKITNIGTNIKRSIISLERENKRRMEIFDSVGVNNIDKYQKLYHEGKVTEPLPHLVIVADEFAELKKEQPEFMSSLVSVARVGRTLGIHLVLATQKPTGVVDDQIDSNSRFRICLKVQDVGDSREMLKMPDAAMITQAGRAYVKIGNFEYYEQLQSYWSGAPYLGDRTEKVSSGNQVRVVALNGERIKTVIDEKTRFKSDVDELKAINNYICYLAEQNGIEQLQGPWLDELPETLEFNEIVSDLGRYDGEKWEDNCLEWLKIPIGKFDTPELQQQGTLCLDFASDGHYGIYGATGTGKTTLLKTMMTSICSLYTPEDVNAYIIDCGGWSMSAYANMPHVGDVILDTDEEKFKKFQKLINDEINSRRKLFLNNVVSSLSAYRESVGKLPAIIVAIDNIIPIFDMYPEMEDTLIRIAREGATYGVYLIYTANSTSGVRFKVLQNIKGAVAFELTDKGDYPTIVGRMECKSIPRNQGRALYKSATPVEFQTALYTLGNTEIERSNNIKNLSNDMAENWKGFLPRRVPVMPNAVDMLEMKNAYNQRNRIPIGINYESISTDFIDLEQSYCCLISGSIGSGKSDLLCKIIDIINNDDNLIYLFDSEKRAFANYLDYAQMYAAGKNEEQVSNAIDEIVQMLNKRQNAQNAAKNEDGYDPVSFIQSEKQICIFIDDINEFVENAENQSRDMMNNIARLAKNLGVILFAAGRTGDISKLCDLEPLTNTIVKYQNGLAIDGSPSVNSFFKNNLNYSEKEANCEKGNAWKFFNGNCEKIKLM